MANTINLFEQYVPLLDEVYKEASKTDVLDGNPELIRMGANANELIIPKMTMDGLADYSRNGGYVGGDVTLTNETVVCNFDRGRMFTVDSMDNAETAGVAFGMLAGEFIRTKVAPELDAFRFATYASAEGVSTGSGTLTTGESVVAGLRAATNVMDENEVPMEDRILFITPTLHGLIQDMDLVNSREVLSRFAQVITVPQTRFYTAIQQNDGTTSGETVGGYTKAADGQDINFMVVHKGAVIQFPKHINPKVVSPEMNPDADAWKFGYRQVSIAQVYENKVAGVYVHHKA
ncbi:MAG: hypothetical protein J6K73_12325 [Clostridia bacterium]|nr:hypothetical protein [Clostridia bacterium]MBP3650553.1 hypothetical protein [Clostridia bacterium]